MRAIEFEATIEHGCVVLPPAYRHLNMTHSRVIILFPEENVLEKPNDKKERLRDAFQNLQRTNPFKSIENPLEWQKKLRDEWE